MREAFQVWFELKNDLLSDVSNPVKHGETYKLAKPQQLYHLDLHDASDIVDNFAPIEEEFKALSVDSPRRMAPPNLARNEEIKPTGALVQPLQIQWVYLDPAGNEQGPFTGDVMQEWWTEGYLSLDLQIRRSEVSSFQTLRLFCESVQNYVQPFQVPLADLTKQAPEVPKEEPQREFEPPNYDKDLAFQTSLGNTLYLPLNNLGANNIRAQSNLFDFMGQGDLLNQPLQFGLDQPMNFSQLNPFQQPQLSRNSSWMQPSLPTAAPTPMLATMGSMGMGTNISQNISQNAPISPWATRMQSLILRVSSPFAPEVDVPVKDMLHGLPSSMVTGILDDDVLHIPVPVSEQVATLSDSSASVIERRTDTSSEPVSELIPEPVVPVSVPDPEPESEPSPVPSPIRKPTAPVEPEQAKPVPSSTVEPEVERVQAPKEPKVLKTQTQPQPEDNAPPALAPWAAASSSESPSLTFKQIQQLEAERMQREKQIKAEMKQELAYASAMAAKAEEKPADKVAFNWISSAQPISAKKTFAEIQKEEEAEAAKSRVAKQPSTPKISLASTLSAATREENGSAWTTVAAKKPVVKKTAQTPVLSYSAASGASNPQALRAASSTTVSSSINSGASHALKEDFVVWARSSMTNLYPSVSKNDLLELFTTLPAQNDSAQLISETIYSSSATMDGRRFAQEFIKRRQQVEKQLGPGASESWSAAITSSADKVPVVDDDGWSTNVKSKKKGKKN